MVDVAGSVTIARPVADVFAFVSDPASEPRWHTAVREVTQLSGGPIGVGTRFLVRYKAVTGLPEATRVLTRFEPDRVIAAESALGRMNSIVTHEFENAPGGTRVTRRVQIGGPSEGLESIGPGVRERNERFLANLKRLLGEAEPTR